MKRILTILLLCCALLVGADAAKAQQSSGVVDGSKNPELIPDNMAWVMMFSFLGDGPKPPTRDFRLGYLEKATLSPKEFDIVFDAASQFMIYERATQRKYKKLKEENPPGPGARERLIPQIQAAHAELMQRAQDLVRVLEDQLGPTAFQRLLGFVRTKVKSEMQL